jgi:hypothetical protein
LLPKSWVSRSSTGDIESDKENAVHMTAAENPKTRKRLQDRKALELDRNFYLAHWTLGWMDIEAAKFSAAIPEIEKARVTDSPPFAAGWLGYAYAAAGERAKAEAMIAQLNQMSSRRFVSPFCTAIIYLGLGDRERAWRCIGHRIVALAGALILPKASQGPGHALRPLLAHAISGPIYSIHQEFRRYPNVATAKIVGNVAANKNEYGADDRPVGH